MESRKTYLRVLAWTPAVLVAAAIFWFSAQPADTSTDLSDGVSRLLLWLGYELGFLDGPPEQYADLIERMSFPVRKCAHVTEYLGFYLTVLFGLYWENRWSGEQQVEKRLMGKPRRKERLKGMQSWEIQPWIAFISVFLYACTDEFHQLFVPGRAGMFTDVLIDSSGAFFLTLILLWWRSRREEKYNGSGRK